jgi:hypothetical protein
MLQNFTGTPGRRLEKFMENDPSIWDFEMESNYLTNCETFKSVSLRNASEL